MSNERSPRESCCTTTGIRGMPGGPFRNLEVARFADGSLFATHRLQEVHMPVVNREVVLPVPRERAWELVTEPAELETWLADDVDFEAEEGAPLRTADGGEVREGVVEHVEVAERIVFTW